MSTLLKRLFSKIGNWILIWIWIILSIWIFGIIYAYTWTAQTNVWAWSWLTSSSWNTMLDNIRYLKENVDIIAGKFWTLTSWKMCTSNWTTVDCNTTIPTSWITTEVDPKVGTLTEWKMCTSVWWKVTCTTTVPTASTCVKWPALYIKTTTTITSIMTCAKSSATSVTTSCTPSAYSSLCSFRPTSCSLLWYLCQ